MGLARRGSTGGEDVGESGLPVRKKIGDSDRALTWRSASGEWEWRSKELAAATDRLGGGGDPVMLRLSAMDRMSRNDEAVGE